MSPKIKFYTDEHVARAVVAGLRRRGIDVLTTQQANNLSAPDIEHLKFARKEGRVIFTQDDDFLRLHTKGEEHAGIVYAAQHTPIGEILRGLMLIYYLMLRIAKGKIPKIGGRGYAPTPYFRKLVASGA
jgi:hypothetical protein